MFAACVKIVFIGYNGKIHGCVFIFNVPFVNIFKTLYSVIYRICVKWIFNLYRRAVGNVNIVVVASAAKIVI